MTHRKELPILFSGGSATPVGSNKQKNKKRQSKSRILKRVAPHQVTFKSKYNGEPISFTSHWKRISERQMNRETNNRYKNKKPKRKRRRRQRGNGVITDLLSTGAKALGKQAPKLLDALGNRVSNPRVKKALKSQLLKDGVQAVMERHKEII